MNDPLVCDTPDSIKAYRLLALKGALTLETKGMCLSGNRRASVMVRTHLTSVGVKPPRNKLLLLATYITWLRANDYLPKLPALRSAEFYAAANP